MVRLTCRHRDNPHRRYVRHAARARGGWRESGGMVKQENYNVREQYLS
jgi:hypothetical protein